MVNAGADGDEVVLAWQRGDGPGRVEFVVTDSSAGDLSSLLAEQGVSATPRPSQVRSAGAGVLTTVTAVAENPAAWVAIGIAVKAFFDRHKGKRIRVDEQGIAEAANYSVADIERIVRALSTANPGEVEEDR